MVTIKQIAEQLGVSPTTVSNVLNGKIQKMSPETRRRIEQALIENNYYRTEKKKEGAIPLVVVGFDTWGKENIVVDPFIGEVLGAIELELRKYGRSVIFTVQKDFVDLKRLLDGYNVEGGIMVGYHTEFCEELAGASPYPLVFIDSGTGNYCNVGLRDKEGMQEITSYLIKGGHKRIAFFCDQEYPAVTNNAKRLQGYKAALDKAGLEFSTEDYVYLPPEQYIRHEILRQFAIKKAKKEYTAGVFVSDLLASEAINIFKETGIAVPHDISVTGFDDNIYARLCRPPLTTVRQSPEAKGREAVRLLMMKIKGEDIGLDSLVLPTELIVRESVKFISQA